MRRIIAIAAVTTLMGGRSQRISLPVARTAVARGPCADAPTTGPGQPRKLYELHPQPPRLGMAAPGPVQAAAPTDDEPPRNRRSARVRVRHRAEKPRAPLRALPRTRGPTRQAPPRGQDRRFRFARARASTSWCQDSVLGARPMHASRVGPRRRLLLANTRARGPASHHASFNVRAGVAPGGAQLCRAHKMHDRMPARGGFNQDPYLRQNRRRTRDLLRAAIEHITLGVNRDKHRCGKVGSGVLIYLRSALVAGPTFGGRWRRGWRRDSRHAPTALVLHGASCVASRP